MATVGSGCAEKYFALTGFHMSYTSAKFQAPYVSCTHVMSATAFARITCGSARKPTTWRTDRKKDGSQLATKTALAHTLSGWRAVTGTSRGYTRSDWREAIKTAPVCIQKPCAVKKTVEQN